ncbi:MAG: hypothetical protein ACLQAH_09610 [Limisphaerales bacterium]
MRLFSPWMLLLAACWPGRACGQLQVLPDREPQRVFAGTARPIAVVWHNTGDQTAQTEVRLRLYLTSSATAALLAEKPWKQIEVLPGQTILESAPMNFPAVNAETRFLIQWLEGTNHVIGTTEMLAYPTNLLGELKPLVGEDNLGVLDPNDELKPLLKQNRVEYSDLGEAALEDFQGKLAIIGPFSTKAQIREGLAPAIQKIARKGAAVVWIRPPPGPKDQIQPSFYIVPEGKGLIVVVQADLVANLPENPKSQLNLVYFCKLALNPGPPSLPDLKTQP